MPDHSPHPSEPTPTRRNLLGNGLRGLGFLAAGSLLTPLVTRRAQASTLWQIDPYKCTYCGKCATDCVLNPSAVKCVQAYQLCGYCRLCTGYFDAEPNAVNEGAENQLCPFGAIRRKHVEDQYFEYSIDASLCTGCAKCVEGCTLYGNGSFFLQIDREICVNCNQCSIASVCPSEAFVRVPDSQPYLLKTKTRQ